MFKTLSRDNLSIYNWLFIPIRPYVMRWVMICCSEAICPLSTSHRKCKILLHYSFPSIRLYWSMKFNKDRKTFVFLAESFKGVILTIFKYSWKSNEWILFCFFLSKRQANLMYNEHFHRQWVNTYTRAGRHSDSKFKI